MPLRSSADRLKKGGWGLKLERRPRSDTLLDAIAVDGERDWGVAGIHCFLPPIKEKKW
jgi:hypothetical protein